jgi:UDP-2-acetamido-3-amino-2,3-dideoxy-glucuronate N-acetyltransferase
MSMANGVDRIHPTAIIGDQVQIANGVSVGAGTVILGPSRISGGCFIAAGCILDPGDDGGSIEVGSNVVIEPGSIIVSGLRISDGARIKAGSVVGRDVPPYAVVAGDPAQIVGYTLSLEKQDSTSVPVISAGQHPARVGVTKTGVNGVSLHRLPGVLDLRGNLTVGEFGRNVPFEPKRYFMVFGVPNAEVRGEHAHRTCEQFLICPHGRCSVVADDGVHRQEFLLDDPTIGLYLPPMTWGIQYKYSPDAILLVFASEYYDPDEYIRNYEEFSLLAGREAPRG